MSSPADHIRRFLSLFQTTIAWMVFRRYHPMVDTPALCQSLTCSFELAGFSLGFFVLISAMIYQLSSFIITVVSRECPEEDESDDESDNDESDEVQEEVQEEEDLELSSDDEESVSSMDQDEEILVNSDDTTIRNAVYTELRNRKLIPKE